MYASYSKLPKKLKKKKKKKKKKLQQQQQQETNKQKQKQKQNKNKTKIKKRKKNLNLSRKSGSWVKYQNNIFTVLIHYWKTTWPTKHSMPFLCSLDNLL